jgi:hypothetical protein
MSGAAVSLAAAWPRCGQACSVYAAWPRRHRRRRPESETTIRYRVDPQAPSRPVSTTRPPLAGGASRNFPVKYGFGSGETPGVWCARRDVSSPFAAWIQGAPGPVGRRPMSSIPGGLRSWEFGIRLRCGHPLAPRRQKLTNPQTATNQRGPPTGAREELGAPANPCCATWARLIVPSGDIRFDEGKTPGVWSARRQGGPLRG